MGQRDENVMLKNSYVKGSTCSTPPHPRAAPRPPPHSSASHLIKFWRTPGEPGPSLSGLTEQSLVSCERPRVCGSKAGLRVCGPGLSTGMGMWEGEGVRRQGWERCPPLLEQAQPSSPHEVRPGGGTALCRITGPVFSHACIPFRNPEKAEDDPGPGRGAGLAPLDGCLL